jgi:hypothetical protein
LESKQASKLHYHLLKGTCISSNALSKSCSHTYTKQITYAMHPKREPLHMMNGQSNTSKVVYQLEDKVTWTNCLTLTQDITSTNVHCWKVQSDNLTASNSACEVLIQA